MVNITSNYRVLPWAPKWPHLTPTYLWANWNQNSKPTPHTTSICGRYIDDIFIIWTGSDEDLETFMGKINSTHPTIKFTHECDDNELTFLDMTVYKGPTFTETGILDIKTHIKKTNNCTSTNLHTTPNPAKKP